MDKLQVLTDKLYQEGVSKGNEEAEKIVLKAKEEANTIIKKAKQDALQIKAHAEKEAQNLMDNTKSELKLAGKQVVNALKQEVVELVNGQITEPGIKAAFEDVAFVQKLIEGAVKNWAASGQDIDISILVPEKDKEKINKYFISNVKGLLDKGVKIAGSKDLKNGFQVGPSDGSYKISFSDADFINFFKEYLRPKIVSLLFSEK